MAQSVVLGSAVGGDANTGGGIALVLVQGANSTTVIAANSTGGSSNIGNPPTADFVLGAHISGLWWSTDGTITILRGANSIMTLNGSGAMSQSNGWRGNNQFPAANLVVNFSSANSSIYVELKKQYK